MGPGDAPNTVLSRPRFSLDLRAVSWTDRIGEQARYAIAVKDWCVFLFHDNLPDTDSRKITPRNRGVLLLTHSYRNAREHFLAIRSDILAAEEGSLLAVNADSKKYALSVVFDV